METINTFFSQPETKTKSKRKGKGKGTRKKRMNCSPAANAKRVTDESCFTPEILMKIRDQYNSKNSSRKITEKDPKKVWYILKERLSCNEEQCVLNQLDNKEQIKKYIFAPKHPPEWNENPDEWLSNIDIQEVAKQYEVSHPEFIMIGPTTIDFDARPADYGGKCVLEDLCNFSLEKFIEAKKTRIGVVFNLDKHDQSGSHWVSLFMDIENKFIFYFDSADNPIPAEIWQKDPKQNPKPLVNRIIEQGAALADPIHFKFYNNRGHGHQRSNTECGMYSLFFIITMLTGKVGASTLSIKARRNLFLKKRIPDESMLKFRKIYFND